GFRTSFMIATGAVLVGLVLAAFLPAPRKERPVLLASSAEDARAASPSAARAAVVSAPERRTAASSSADGTHPSP
ncbi:MAG TPA: MFS transporter, partial [Streptomyces sp.]|nr:MFS transporter [Streptomyces sp.]